MCQSEIPLHHIVTSEHNNTFHCKTPLVFRCPGHSGLRTLPGREGSLSAPPQDMANSSVSLQLLWWAPRVWWRASLSASQTVPSLKWLKVRQGRRNDWLGKDSRGFGARQLTETEVFLFVGKFRPVARNPPLTQSVTQPNSLTFHCYSWVTAPEQLGGFLNLLAPEIFFFNFSTPCI